MASYFKGGVESRRVAGPGQGGLVPQALASPLTQHRLLTRAQTLIYGTCGGGGDYRQTIREDHPRWQQGMTAVHMHRNSAIFIRSRQG